MTEGLKVTKSVVVTADELIGHASIQQLIDFSTCVDEAVCDWSYSVDRLVYFLDMVTLDIDVTGVLKEAPPETLERLRAGAKALLVGIENMQKGDE